MTSSILELVARAGVAPTGNSTGPPAQAGVLEGANPAQYTPDNPITLFIIQASIVIIFCQMLHYPLRLLGQPRVIAEVIGGIILGPSVMMRIPGFKQGTVPTLPFEGKTKHADKSRQQSSRPSPCPSSAMLQT